MLAITSFLALGLSSPPALRYAHIQQQPRLRTCRMDVHDDIPDLAARTEALRLARQQQQPRAPLTTPKTSISRGDVTLRSSMPQSQRVRAKPSTKSASMFAGSDHRMFEFGMMALGLDYASGTGPYSAAKMSATKDGTCKILCVGVGGGGGNTVNRLVQGIGNDAEKTLSFMALNTDQQALDVSLAEETLTLGSVASRGLGAGGKPEVGRICAEEAAADIAEAVAGVDMVFITAGMGGGTGSGAAPVVAEIARQHDCLTVGVVTKPFGFEGKRRMQQVGGLGRAGKPHRPSGGPPPACPALASCEWPAPPIQTRALGCPPAAIPAPSPRRRSISTRCHPNPLPWQALDAIDELERQVDILIVVANDRLLQIVPEDYPLDDAFLLADEILRQVC